MENKISNYNKLLIQELCDEHNKLRKNPECYIPLLRKVLILIRRNNILHLQGERPFKTIEGKEAVLEAINYLSNMNKSLVEKLSNRLFIISDYLNKASIDHADDIGYNSSTSHIGSDNSHINDRVEKYCDWGGGLAESLDFGTIKAQNIMLKLLICDGDKKRTQRNYIFDPGFIYFGAGFSMHIKYKKCCVISYAAFVQPKNADLSEKELIRNCLDIHKNFKNKNIFEINKYFNNNINLSKDETEKIIDKKEDNENNENNEDDGENDKLSYKRINSFEEQKENKDDLLVIVENENDNEKDEKFNEINENNKIKKIKEKNIHKKGIELKETTYEIKEGNFHIIEEEKKSNNFSFLNLI